MDENQFRMLLDQLSSVKWQAVVEGQAVLLVDDLRLEVGPADAPNAILFAAGQTDGESLKRESLDEAASLLHNYYLTHPLTLAGFNHQVEALVRRHGAGAFAAAEGRLPQFTLFVEGGEVVAEPLESPRHKYGVFCELDRPLNDSEVEARVRKWLERGDAHERYMGMNVCRYNC